MRQRCQPGASDPAICSPSVNAHEGSRRRVLSLRAWRKQRSGRWSGRASATLVLASAALCGSAPIAAASSSDAQATHAYLIAQYKLSRALLHEATVVRGAESAAAAQIARECRGVVSGIPQPSTKLLPTPTPRARGENARLTHQQETIEKELATAIAKPGDSAYRPAQEAYAAEVRQLSWSDPTIASLVQAATAAQLEDSSTPAPSFCADARAWAQSSYRALSPASREFEARKSSASREERSLGTLLKPYENASDRALLRKPSALDVELLLSAGAAVQTVFRLNRILGFPQAETEESKKQIVLGRGRTAAGTRFEVSAGTSSFLGVGGSCHHSVSIAYSQLGGPPEVLVMGGPNNPICLSSPHERHPALFCEAGIETIQTAVPASVRSVRLVLADGRMIESRVVHVSPRHGGPAGVYAQELRGSSSHAVSLVELSAGDEVVLTLTLPRYRCVKPREQPGILPSVVELATGHTPEGESFTIGALGNLDGEPFLSVDTGINPQLDEVTVGPQAPKAFPWSLSIGCAPHPYAILYGILAPPGKSVTAQTPQGAVALNVVPIEPRLRAEGPVVYGVFSALPYELSVLGANGSTLYTENLQSQATEAAQFCEGYAEP
jgi:hypothetical protein